MILLIDADSLIFASCYRHKENPEDNPHFENIEDSIAKFDEQFMKLKKLLHSTEVKETLES